jgi:excisionase family DNA binding protein
MAGAKSTTIDREDRRAIAAAMPAIRRVAPEAAMILDGVVGGEDPAAVAPASPYVSIAEVATAFDVTQQTIRNWVDRGWLPADRSPGGTRRIPRRVLASADALSRPRPAVPELSQAEIDAIISAPRPVR